MMFFNRSSAAACALLFLMNASAWAHPGHGSSDSDPVLHYIVEPSHGWWIVLPGALAAGRWLFLRSRSMKAVQANANEHRSREQ